MGIDRCTKLAWVLSVLSTTAWAEPPIAVVDGSPITREEFLRAYQEQKVQFAAQGVSSALLVQVGIPTQVIEALIEQKLLAAEAKAREIHVSDAELRKAISEVKTEGVGLDEKALEAQMRGFLTYEKVLLSVDATVSVTAKEIHDRCQLKTDLALIAFVAFDVKGFVSDVKPPTELALAAWAKAHDAEVSAQFKRDARALSVRDGVLVFADDGIRVPGAEAPLTSASLWALRPKYAWLVGDEKKLRSMIVLERYLDDQARALARAEAQKALDAVKKGKTLDALFPEAVQRSQRAFSPLDPFVAGLQVTPALSAAVFARKTPGPVAKAISAEDIELTIVVEQRAPLREAVCQKKAATFEAEVRDEKVRAARNALLKALHDKAKITVDRVAVDALTSE